MPMRSSPLAVNPGGEPCPRDLSQESDLARLHNDAIKNDPFVSKALGPNPKIERMRAAPLRLGSQGVSVSYDDHLLIIGDAAGHIDPLTGEGIHTAIMVCAVVGPRLWFRANAALSHHGACRSAVRTAQGAAQSLCLRPTGMRCGCELYAFTRMA